MPAFDLDLNDPTADLVEKAMVQAVETANQRCRVGLLTADRGAYRRFIADELRAAPEGVALWLAEKGRVEQYPPTPRATLLGVAWRRTPAGQRVRVVGRRIEPFKETPANRFGPPWRVWPPLCLLDTDHVALRTFAGGEPEMVAVCGCGAVGPPTKLGWTLGMCGPCHDHREKVGRPLTAGMATALRAGGPLRRVGWLPSGETVAAVEWGGFQGVNKVVEWDRRTGAALTVPLAGGDAATPDEGVSLAVRPQVYRIVEGAAVHITGVPFNLYSFAFAGATAVGVHYNGAAYRRELPGDARWVECWPERRAQEDDRSYTAVALAPDLAKVALGGNRCAVDVLDWPGGSGPTLRPPAIDADEMWRVHAVAFSPDGKLLAAGYGLSGFVEDPNRDWYGWDGGMHLYDATRQAFLADFRTPKNDVLAVAFSPDGSLLFYAGTDCQIHALDVKTRTPVAVLGGHVGGVNHLAFSPDGSTLASAGGDGLIRLWPWREVLRR